MTNTSPRPAEGVGLVLPPLYPIIDIDMCGMRGIDPLALVAAYLAGGARLLQIRQKLAGTGALLAVSRAAVAEARESGAIVIVNDRSDVAIMSHAAGVHVGQQDLPVDRVRRLLGPAAIVGISTHTEAEVDRALTDSSDYVAVGPVFSTATKDTGYEPRGLALVRYASGRGKPIVAIGGITLERAPAVLAAGAASVAVISELMAATGAESRVRAMLRAIS